MVYLKMLFLRLACTCEETCESVSPPKLSLYAISTCVHLRLLAHPFHQGFINVLAVENVNNPLSRHFEGVKKRPRRLLKYTQQNTEENDISDIHTKNP